VKILTARFKSHLKDFRKTLKMKWGDIRTRVRGNLTAVVWKEKRNVKHVDKHASTSSRSKFL
jgi:hypothetical protein